MSTAWSRFPAMLPEKGWEVSSKLKKRSGGWEWCQRSFLSHLQAGSSNRNGYWEHLLQNCSAYRPSNAITTTQGAAGPTWYRIGRCQASEEDHCRSHCAEGKCCPQLSGENWPWSSNPNKKKMHVHGDKVKSVFLAIGDYSQSGK